MEYDKLLEKARKDLPDSVFEKERFEIPKVMGHIQGNKTVMNNTHQIANELGRPVDHLLKFLLKELATPGTKKKNAVILGAKTSASRINEKIREYANEFVLCPACGKPDTKIQKEGKMRYLKCTACGNKNIIRSRV